MMNFQDHREKHSLKCVLNTYDGSSASDQRFQLTPHYPLLVTFTFGPIVWLQSWMAHTSLFLPCSPTSLRTTATPWSTASQLWRYASNHAGLHAPSTRRLPWPLIRSAHERRVGPLVAIVCARQTPIVRRPSTSNAASLIGVPPANRATIVSYARALSEFPRKQVLLFAWLMPVYTDLRIYLETRCNA